MRVYDQYLRSPAYSALDDLAQDHQGQGIKCWEGANCPLLVSSSDCSRMIPGRLSFLIWLAPLPAVPDHSRRPGVGPSEARQIWSLMPLLRACLIPPDTQFSDGSHSSTVDRFADTHRIEPASSLRASHPSLGGEFYPISSKVWDVTNPNSPCE